MKYFTVNLKLLGNLLELLFLIGHKQDDAVRPTSWQREILREVDRASILL
jgi:hypothetical protein